MTSRHGHRPLARLHHGLPKIVLWLLVTVIAAVALTSTLSTPADATHVHELPDWHLFSYGLHSVGQSDAWAAFAVVSAR